MYAYVEIKGPGGDERIPSWKIACGEKPLVECLVANSIHLAEEGIKSIMLLLTDKDKK